MTERENHLQDPESGAGKAASEKRTPLKERLARLGLATSWDYVLHLPLRYEDKTAITAIGDLKEGVAAQIEGRVVSRQVTPNRLSAVLSDGTGELRVTLLRYFSPRQFEEGKSYRLWGEAKPAWGGAAGLEMLHPKVLRPLKPGEALPDTLTPVYPASDEVGQTPIRNRVDKALFDADLNDPIPIAIRKRLALPKLRDALHFLHHPPAGTTPEELDRRTSPAWRRLKFGELLAQQTSLLHAKETRAQRPAPALRARELGSLTEKLMGSLPFELTAAQHRVWTEVARDLSRTTPMSRLVQGDVGSGKTVVAALAAARAIEGGFQAALMAPTEILAEQHYRSLSRWLSPLGVKVVWLSGNLKASDKQAAIRALAQGEAQLAVGTHALIQEGVEFKALGLAIIDEQHRFGVAQRLALGKGKDKDKGGLVPHLLMLSATPIPRTLAMSYFADFDVSVIDELPPGRVPVSTRILSDARKAELIASLGKEIAAGRQAYWVCPLIEESDVLALASAKKTFEEIRAALPAVTVGLMHGALPADEKERVMRDFASGRIGLLVATTVIEVGVDVPNATIMVIEHAERFGLAQLHQLRGRTGRGAMKSWCFLLYGDPLSEAGKERLKAIRSTTDGFEIARLDLQIRGPGELLGERQAGAPILRFADLATDQALIGEARQAAIEWLASDPGAALRHAQRWYPQAPEAKGPAGA